MINKVTLIGNLGSDPEVKHLESGAMVARFSLATNESYKDKDGNWQTLTEWHNVVVWRELAERAEKTLKKGTMVYVDGKISYRKYQDKDGVERYATDIVANIFRKLERSEGTGQYSEAARFPSEDRAPAPRPQQQPVAAAPMTQSAPAGGGNDSMPQEGDDLPF